MLNAHFNKFKIHGGTESVILFNQPLLLLKRNINFEKKNKVFILNNSTDFYKILTHIKVQEKSSISLKAFFSNLETIGAMIH